MDYPAVKVYTVTQRHHKPISPTGTDQPVSPTTNPQFRGPRNHRHLSVERLYRLPFPDNHFDVVSARTIFLILKTQALNKPAGQLIDEYNRCIEECMRVLKPGGYFEFMLFDSDIINAGPLASELCARFSVSLTSTGRDPEPTKMWITRLNNAGFHDIKRSWVFLPMSPPVQKPRVPSKDEKECPHLPPIPPAGASGSTLQAQQQQQWQPLNTDSQDLDDVKEQVRRKLRAWDSAATSNAAQNPSTTSTTASKDPKKVEKPLMGSVADVAAVSGLLTGWTWERWLRNAGIVDEEETVGNMMEEAKEMGSGLRCLVGWARKGVAAATAVTITAS
jgi:SAM-dependent methyltransferase